METPIVLFIAPWAYWSIIALCTANLVSSLAKWVVELMIRRKRKGD